MPTLTEKLKAQLAARKSSDDNKDPGSDPTAVPGEALRAKLRELGDRRDINPPPPSPEEAAPPPEASTTPPAPSPNESSSTHKTKRTEPGGACPFCGKEFKHLSRHRCPEAPSAGRTVSLSGRAHILRPPTRSVEVQAEEPKVEDQLNQAIAESREASEASEKASPFKPPAFLENHEGKAEEEVLEPLRVLVNCFPTKALDLDRRGYRITFLEDYISREARDIAIRNGVAHWSLVEFGGGPGLLADALRRKLRTDSIFGYLLIDTRTQEGKACLSVAREFANEVIEGF